MSPSLLKKRGFFQKCSTRFGWQLWLAVRTLPPRSGLTDERNHYFLFIIFVKFFSSPRGKQSSTRYSHFRRESAYSIIDEEQLFARSSSNDPWLMAEHVSISRQRFSCGGWRLIATPSWQRTRICHREVNVALLRFSRLSIDLANAHQEVCWVVQGGHDIVG